MTEPMASHHQRQPTRCAIIRISDIWICFEFVISDFEFPYRSIATVLSRPFLTRMTAAKSVASIHTFAASIAELAADFVSA